MISILAALAAAASSHPHAEQTVVVRAEPKGELSRLFTRSDYPTLAPLISAPHAVPVRLAVASNGRVTDCTIIESSGVAQLDSATCRILRGRARFIPARDAAGNPIADETAYTHVWTPPS